MSRALPEPSRSRPTPAFVATHPALHRAPFGDAAPSNVLAPGTVRAIGAARRPYRRRSRGCWMRFFPLLLLALPTPVLAAPAPQVLDAFPVKFRGEWARSLAECASRGGENTSGFKVTARAITYYEDSETVREVR